MRRTRKLNEYTVIYMPEHHRSMQGKNWGGWVYEHIVVAEEKLGRRLRENEVTHHLDGDRENNRSENLLVLERSQHAKLHLWLSKGAPGREIFEGNGLNCGKPKSIPNGCHTCGRTLQGRSESYCSVKCRGVSQRVVRRPSKEQLEKDLSERSYNSTGKKYGVSHAAVKKWAINYGIDTVIRSQALGTPEEGSETTGEVESS